MKTGLLVVYCLLILSASFLGGWLPTRFRWTPQRLQLALSFVGGLMLGVAVLHLVPHSVFYTGSIDVSAPWILGGLLGMFFLHRFTSFHHHDLPELEEGSQAACTHDHDHAGHDHAAHGHGGHSHGHVPAPGDFWGWAGVAFGLGLHTLIDGISLAASVEADWSHSVAMTAGMATFLVVFLHKPFDAMAISTLLVASTHGKSAFWRHGVNLGFAMLVPLGVFLFHVGVNNQALDRNWLIGVGLGLAAGNFLFLAAGDLLPDLQFSTENRWPLAGMMLAGVGLSVAIGWLEHSGHDHHHPPPAATAASTHDHGHDHGHDHSHDHGTDGHSHAGHTH